jgi:predicted MFS family arabinose efflux permease
MTLDRDRYRKYMLNVLLIILAFNWVDRKVLGMLLQDIKGDLGLTDTQLGFLSGIAFAAFYSVMGLPIARWADRGNRVAIISITTLLWSSAVAMCGLAGTYMHLLLIRVGVAVGEAGCIPPAHSLIADYFNRQERPRAVARYMLGAPLSVVIGYFLAGWLNELFGWRMTFMLLGIPGLALAALAWFTLKEPRCERPKVAGKAEDSPSLKEVFVTLWRNVTFRHLLLCLSVLYFFGYGTLQWKPAFFMRSYGLETGTLGTWLAVIYGICGFLGTYWGGELASRHAAGNEPLQLKGMAIAYCGFGIISACLYLSPTVEMAFVFLALSVVGYNMTNGPLFALVQTLVPDRMRAMSIALIFLFANLIGMGLGPLAAGMLSDAFRPWAGQESLRYALLTLSPGYLWAGWHVWRGSRTVSRDLEVVRGTAAS